MFLNFPAKKLMERSTLGTCTPPIAAQLQCVRVRPRFCAVMHVDAIVCSHIRESALTHTRACAHANTSGRAHGGGRVFCFRARASNTNEALGRERREKFEAFLQVVS